MVLYKPLGDITVALFNIYYGSVYRPPFSGKIMDALVFEIWPES